MLAFPDSYLAGSAQESLALRKDFIRTYLEQDSGLVHALLGIQSYEDLAGHPIVGASWEGFVIENLLAVAPARTLASFYRTMAGAEIDLLLDIPGEGAWAIEIKRGLTSRPGKGFHIACGDLKPKRRFVVYAGLESYPLGEEIEAVSLPDLMQALTAL